MRLNIDFAPQSRWPGVKSGLLLLLALFVTGDALWELSRQSTQYQAAENTLAGVRLRAKQLRNAVPHKQVEAVNRAVLQLNLPWAPLLMAIEEQLNDEVALLSLEPDAARQVLRIQGEAKSSDAMLDFVKKLGKKELFQAVVLTRHEINESDRNKPYRFTLEAQWRLPS